MKFAEIVEMIKSGKHRELAGIKKIIKLAYQMNIGGKYRKVKQEDLLHYLESSETTC